MTDRCVVVFGGSGFLGRRIVERLAAAGARVRVAVRCPETARFEERNGALGQVTTLRADVREEDSVAAAVEGSDAVVDAVGLYVERGAATFDAVHVQGALHVARQSARAGAGRLVHVSGIGADAHSSSRYVGARARGESRVIEAFEGATILRPSVLFGPGDAFFNSLAGIARVAPVLPLFGSGGTRLQPVFVDDVAEAVVRALGDPNARGKVYELGGPRVYSYRALVELLLARIGRKPVLLPLPFVFWKLQAGLLAVLPDPPLTRDQVILMERDNVVGPSALTFADLGIEPRAVETVLPDYL